MSDARDNAADSSASAEPPGRLDGDSPLRVLLCLAGLAAAVQPPRGLRCQVLLIPDVAGGGLHGLERVFPTGSFQQVVSGGGVSRAAPSSPHCPCPHRQGPASASPPGSRPGGVVDTAPIRSFCGTRPPRSACVAGQGQPSRSLLRSQPAGVSLCWPGVGGSPGDPWCPSLPAMEVGVWWAWSWLPVPHGPLSEGVEAARLLRPESLESKPGPAVLSSFSSRQHADDTDGGA